MRKYAIQATLFIIGIAMIMLLGGMAAKEYPYAKYIALSSIIIMLVASAITSNNKTVGEVLNEDRQKHINYLIETNKFREKINQMLILIFFLFTILVN